MAFSMAGLASTMQGHDQAIREMNKDAEAVQNTALNKIKYDQAVRDDAMNKQREGYGEEPSSGGLGSATAKAQTNGARLMDSVLELFSGKKPGDTAAPQPAAGGIGSVPSYGASAPANQPAQSAALPQTPSPALAGTPGFSGVGVPIQPKQQSAKPKVATPYSDLRRQRAEAYIKAHPNDAKGYAGMIAEADSLHKLENDHRVQVFNEKHAEAARLGAKSRDVKYFVKNYNEDLPNGDQVDAVLNPDGSYSIVGLVDRKERENLDKTNPLGLKGFEAFQWKHSQLNHPEKLIEVFDKQGEKRFETDQKIRQDKAKAEAETEQGRISGAHALNRAHVGQITNTILNSNIDRAEKTRIKELADAVAKTTEGSPEEKTALRAYQLASGTYGKPEAARFDSGVVDGKVYVLDKRNGVNRFEDPHNPDKPTSTTGKQDVTVAGKVIGQASSPEEAKALVSKYKAGSAQVVSSQSQPVTAQPDPVKFNYATKSASRGLRDIQAEIDSLPQLAPYVRPDVKAAQAAKYRALVQERDKLLGLRSIGVQPVWPGSGFGYAFKNGAQ
ncbi:MAG: hypothetical protein Q8L80_06835 [Gallionella sp.]|nr:hypothetical protein [Gallionella sp.]